MTIASQLLAQVRASTDPDRLVAMAAESIITPEELDAVLRIERDRAYHDGIKYAIDCHFAVHGGAREMVAGDIGVRDE